MIPSNELIERLIAEIRKAHELSKEAWLEALSLEARSYQARMRSDQQEDRCIKLRAILQDHYDNGTDIVLAKLSME